MRQQRRLIQRVLAIVASSNFSPKGIRASNDVGVGIASGEDASCQSREERDASNAVTKRFYGEDEQIGGTAYYATRDHLGSVRELTDTAGTIRARYDYELYGKRTANLVTANPVESSFGFTGHYEHAQSGLTLAPCRAYNSALGRWISRDPIGEEGGL